MINQQDFDAAASDICDRVVTIRDTQLVLTIEKWLAKLTSSETRGANELNYLKLLQYMVANQRIGRPFIREPPLGPLLPLSRYINPPPCSRLLGRRKNAADGTGWRTTSCSRAAQTVDYDDSDDSADIYDDEGVETRNSRQLSNRVGVWNANTNASPLPPSTSNSRNANDDDDDHDDSGQRRKKALAGVRETDGSNTTRKLVTKRDGHLAGGECDSVKNAAKKEFVKFCDPCLDDLGKYKKNAHVGPVDAAYADLLGACALPELTENEQSSVCPELLEILKNVNDKTTLQDFYFQVALCTCDQGELLMRVSNGMLDDFREFATDVFESRAEHISDGLAREQMLMNDKYTYLEHRMLNRATVGLNFLRETMPAFNWYKYQDSVDGYLKRLISRQIPAAGRSSKDPNCHEDDAAATDNRADDDDNDDGDDEDDDVQRSVALKKLLYTLNRQRSDVTRVECEGQRLYEQRNELLATLAECNAKLSAIQSRSSGDVTRLKDELTLLKKQSADQTVTVDRLMESTQFAMQNKKHHQSTNAANC